MDEKVLRKSFAEIVRGYSETFFKKKVYIKHFNILDQSQIDQVYLDNYELAKSKKSLTEKDRLDLLIKQGDWSLEKEKGIENIKRTLDAIIQNKKRAVVPSQLRALKEQEDRERKELEKILQDRAELIGSTCESFAEKRSNDFYVFNSLYKDSSLEDRFFTEEEFDELSELETNFLVGSYNKAMSFHAHLKKIALSPFFQNLLSLSSEDAYSFFGVPVAKLTHYQSELLLYGRYFKSLLENNQNIPPEMRDDPDRLVDFIQVKENFDKTLEKSETGAVGIPNATPQDLKELGVEHLIDPTADRLKKSGKKSLSMAELMNL